MARRQCVSDPHGAPGRDAAQDAEPDVTWSDDHDGPAVPPSSPVPPVTGDSVVDEAVAQLQYVTALPVDEQPLVYDSVHRSLQDRLADVEG
jgi:hypothetical protein